MSITVRMLLLLVVGVALPRPALAAIDALVVCPIELRAALAPWIALRTAEGHEIGVIANAGTPEQVRAAIRRAAAGGVLKTVLLVGAATPRSNDDAAPTAGSVPVHYETSRVGVRFGGTADIPTDNYYADLDGDGLPDLAIGRLPVNSPAELSAIVRRILTYERQREPGPWQRQINLVSGPGGFGPFLDGLLEGAAQSFLAAGVPAGYQTSMTYADWQSPYCPDPRLFGRTALARFNEGCLFWIYLGHGRVHDLDMLRVPFGRYPILAAADVRQVCCRRGSPVALLFCCDAGAFDQPRACLAEELLRQEGGPVAVLAGSRVTMPYGMATLGIEMLNEYFQQQRPTFGDIVLRAKRSLAGNGSGSPQRLLLDGLAALASPTRGELAAERREHVQLFNLLGDPLLSMHYPQPVMLSAPRRPTAGRRIEVQGKSPIAGRCRLELVVRRDRLTFTPDSRLKFDASDAALARFQQVYAKANDPLLDHAELSVSAGEFHATLQVPDNAEGPCHVRAFVEGARDCALGSADVEVIKVEPHTAMR